MIRTTLSVCALFGTLLLASKLVVQSSMTPPAAISPAPNANQPVATPIAKPAPATVAPAAAATAKPLPSSSSKTKSQNKTDGLLVDGCVEIPCGEDLRTIPGANTDGKLRVSVAEYLHGPIPSPHAFMSKPVGYEDELSTEASNDETADVFGPFLPLRVANKNDSSDEQPEMELEGTESETIELETNDQEARGFELGEPAKFSAEADPLETDDAELPPELQSDSDSPAEAPADDATMDAETNESLSETSTADDITPAKTAKPPVVLTPELVQLREKLRDCLAHYYYRPENAANRSPWGAMHYMLAYGVDSQLIASNRRVNACGWLCYNGVCNGQNLFWVEQDQMHARIGVGVQGHAGQFLSMLAQSKVPASFPMKVDGQDFTVANLIEHEKATCKPNSELTFKLISLVHYCQSDDEWTSNDGQQWDIPRLIREELKQPIIGAACGGTHRLMGHSYAIRKREQRNEKFTGQWLRAKKFIEAYQDYTFQLQNPDGSFSTDWFVGRADFGPPARRLETTGHITEWLAYSLPEDRLTDPQMIKSVNYLTDLLYNGRTEKWNIGPLGHGLHALAMYDERVFGGKPGERNDQLAQHVERRTASKQRVRNSR